MQSPSTDGSTSYSSHTPRTAPTVRWTSAATIVSVRQIIDITAQADPAQWPLGVVDIKTKGAFQYMLLLL